METPIFRRDSKRGVWWACSRVGTTNFSFRGCPPPFLHPLSPPPFLPDRPSFWGLSPLFPSTETPCLERMRTNIVSTLHTRCLVSPELFFFILHLCAPVFSLAQDCLCPTRQHSRALGSLVPQTCAGRISPPFFSPFPPAFFFFLALVPRAWVYDSVFKNVAPDPWPLYCRLPGIYPMRVGELPF